MGITRYKKTIDCECGCDYGGCCGRKISFLFCYNRSCDIGSLYINEHAEKEDSQYVHWRSMQDNEISALIQVLSSSEPIEPITDEERKLI